MEPNRRTLFGVGIVALTLLTAAGGLALAQDSGSSTLDSADDGDAISASNVSLSEEDAIDIATAEANGTVEEVELESEDGTPVYEVEIVASNGSETEVAVHADDGTVLETESEDREDEENENDEMDEENENEEDGEDEESVAPGTVGLTEKDAMGIATAEANGTVGEVELENEDGTPVYEVEIVASNDSETEITVDADDGTVLETETENE